MADTASLPGPLERPGDTFSGRAVEVLRTMVLVGQLRAGQRLNEVELAHALGISRGPLREAIQRLRSEGLLTAVSGRGSYVRTFSADALADLYEVRIALETHAARLAAQKLGLDVSSEELEALLDVTDHANAEFHQRIVAVADSPALLDTVTAIHRQIQLARGRSGLDADRAEQARDEHRAVLHHVADGEGDKAAAVLEEHLRHSLRNALELLEREASRSPPVG